MNLLDLIFPKTCVGCKKTGTYFCPVCIQEIKQGDLVCPFCERSSIGGITHPVCRRKYGLDGLWSLGIYENPLRKAIQKLKYKFVEELSLILTDILIEYLAKYSPIFLDKIKKDRGEGWILTPVPLHWMRQNSRGFNQASLVSSLIAKKLGLKYQEILIRAKNTKTQVKKDAYQRRENIKNAFVLTKPYTLNANILLVDDVWTTGSTLKECCYILKRSGAKVVWALTLAR